MKTTLWLGSGAVKNSWDPIFRALGTNQKEDANFLLARLIYLCRFTGNRKEKPGGKDVLKSCLDTLNQIKKRICSELKQSRLNKELTVQPEFRTIAEKIVFDRCNQLKIISTNWDDVVDEEFLSILHERNVTFGKDDVTHMHGHLDSESTIYLPTEMVEEIYREEEERKWLERERAISLAHGQESDHFVIYGLSLSALDAELGQIFSNSICAGKVKVVDIIDCKPDLVANKIRILNDVKHVFEIREHKPEDFH